MKTKRKGVVASTLDRRPGETKKTNKTRTPKSEDTEGAEDKNKSHSNRMRRFGFRIGQ